MIKHYIPILLILLLGSCATYQTKYSAASIEKGKTLDATTTKPISHTFFLIGDAGLSPKNELNPVLKAFKKSLDKADEEQYGHLFRRQYISCRVCE